MVIIIKVIIINIYMTSYKHKTLPQYAYTKGYIFADIFLFDLYAFIYANRTKVCVKVIRS